MSDKHQNVFFFQCDKELKEEFHQICVAKGANPNSLLRAFMRKVIKEYKHKQEIQEKLAQQAVQNNNSIKQLTTQLTVEANSNKSKNKNQNDVHRLEQPQKLSLSEEFRQDIEESQDYIDGLSDDLTKSGDSKVE
jgi:antitoxin component of RelBE/YafQ-DinJ toxin-antitoxin module